MIRAAGVRSPSWPIALLVLCSWNGFLAVLLGKDLNWDLLNYHVYNPYAFVTGRRDLDVVPAQMQTFLNPLLDIPLYLALVALPPIVIGALYGLVQGLNGVAVWLVAREVLPGDGVVARGWVALGLAFLGGLGAINVSELGGSMADTLASIPLLFALALLVRWRDRLETAPLPATAAWACVAGALGGVGISLKLTSALYSAGFAVGCLFLVRAPARRLLVAVAFGVGGVVSWLLVSGFWLWELWTRFGNPLFPYFNNLFRSEFAPLVGMRDERFLPGSALGAFLYPLVWAIHPQAVAELPFRDWRFALIYCLLAMLGVRWCVRRWQRKPAAGFPSGATAFLLAGALISYGLWLWMFGIYRYLALLEWLVPLGITLALWTLLPPRRRAIVILTALLLITVTTKPMSWGRTTWTGSYFGVVPPRLERPDSSMVLMAGFEPLSFLIPHFPDAVRFVRIQGNVNGRGPVPNRLDRLVEQTVAAYPGNLYVMFGGSDTPEGVDDVLRKLGLRRRAESCEVVRALDVLPRVVLCSVSHAP